MHGPGGAVALALQAGLPVAQGWSCRLCCCPLCMPAGIVAVNVDLPQVGVDMTLGKSLQSPDMLLCHCISGAPQ
jgi:hypothetical protein